MVCSSLREDPFSQRERSEQLFPKNKSKKLEGDTSFSKKNWSRTLKTKNLFKQRWRWLKWLFSPSVFGSQCFSLSWKTLFCLNCTFSENSCSVIPIMMHQPKTLSVLNLFSTCNSFFFKNMRLSTLFWALIEFFSRLEYSLEKKVFFVLCHNGDLQEFSEKAKIFDLSRFSNTLPWVEICFYFYISVSKEQQTLVEETFSQKV